MEGQREVEGPNRFGTRTYGTHGSIECTRHAPANHVLGAPETFATSNATAFSKSNVRSSMDIWSLGAIYSEAAVWTLHGPEGLKRYREARQMNIRTLPVFDQVNDCFHDGEQVLAAVEQQHGSLLDEVIGEHGERKLMRSLTGRVVNVVIEQMLLADPSSRRAAKDLYPQAEKLLTRARPAAQPFTIFEGEHPNAAGPASPSTSAEMSQFLPNQQMQLFRSPSPTLQSFSLSTVNDTVDALPQRAFSIRSRPIQHDRGDSGWSEFGENTSRANLRTHERTLSDQELSVALDQAITSAGAPPETAPVRTFSPPQRHSARQVNDGDVFGAASGAAGLSTPQDVPQTRRAAAMESQSKAENVPKLSVDELQTWYEAKKQHTGVLQLEGAEWLLRDLEKRDHVSPRATVEKSTHMLILQVFFVDDSSTMHQYWPEVTRLVKLLVYLIKERDPDGADLYFLGSDTRHKVKTATAALDQLRAHMCKGHSSISGRLGEEVQRYCQKFSRAKSFLGMSVRPRTLYILTDGVLAHGDHRQGHQEIRTLTVKLLEMSYSRKQFGIQFIRFGNDPGGIHRLDVLDSLNQTANLGL
jgi:hypothetical protein